MAGPARRKPCKRLDGAVAVTCFSAFNSLRFTEETPADAGPRWFPSSGAPARSGSSLIVTLVAATFFMENLDGTIIATALPQMARSFGVHPADMSLGITAYLLTLAVFIPISGWAADRFGLRTVFGSAIAVFTAASVLCATTSHPARVRGGAGAAGHRRRDDGAGRPARRAARDAQRRPDARDRDHHLAGARRAGDRPAARRLHHDLFVVALDLLSEPAARLHRPRRSRCAISTTRARTPAAASTCPASRSAASPARPFSTRWNSSAATTRRGRSSSVLIAVGVVAGVRRVAAFAAREGPGGRSDGAARSRRSRSRWAAARSFASRSARCRSCCR